MTSRVFGAVDVGASGGRVIAAVVADGAVTLRTVHRFSNGPMLRQGRLRWDITTIFDEVLVGLRLLGQEFPAVESIGIDTWGVDYGLLDADGILLADPVSYRDERTHEVIDQVHAVSAPRSSTPSTDCNSCPSPPSTNWPPSGLVPCGNGRPTSFCSLISSPIG